MKSLIEIANNRRTIREFTDKKVDEAIVNEILDAVMHTATSTGIMQASIIRVTDDNKKRQLAEVGGQEYVGRASELFIFIADNYRNYKIIQDKNVEYKKESEVDMFLQGYTDASLLAQNTYFLLEQYGLSGVFLGCILNDAKKTMEILNMPQKTFPVLGLGFGYANQNPQIKPKLKKEFRVFENEYKDFGNYSNVFDEFDKEMSTYYDLRDANNRVDDFTTQVIKKVNAPKTKRDELLNMARENGYLI